MDDEERTAGRTYTVPLYDGDYLFAMNILKNLYLGPGEPGPGDEWKFPTEPAAEGEPDAVVEPAQGELPRSPIDRR